MDEPLAGFLHWPVRPVVGGAVVCNPFGYEAGCAHRTLRYLASRLAQRGVLCLRFDYLGTGASSKPGAAREALDDWQRSVAAAISEMRRHGEPRPTLIGLRLGAALAGAAAGSDPEVGPLVLWAPLTQGKRLVKELRAASLITPGEATFDGNLNAIGHLVSTQTLAALRTWQPFSKVSLTRRTLLVQSPGWRDAATVVADLTSSGLRPETIMGKGTHEVLERDAELVLVPRRLVDRIVSWVVETIEPVREPIARLPVPPKDQRRALSETDGPVVEELVSMGRDRIHGVLTTPAAGHPRAAVVFLNNGVASAAGPARAWTDFGRRLGSEGLASLRVDLTGLGDSPDKGRPVVRKERPIPRTAGEEVAQIVEELRHRSFPDVILVGLCSGASIALTAAAADPQLSLSGVVAINPPLFNFADIGTNHPKRVWRLGAFIMRRGRLRACLHRLPEGFWTMLDRADLFPLPTRLLRAASNNVRSLTLVFSDPGPELADIRARGGQAFAELAGQWTATVRVFGQMDHSLFDHTYRDRILDVIRAALAYQPDSS